MAREVKMFSVGWWRSKFPKEYNSWSSMISRCYCKTHKSYPNYGGRGVTVCDRWRHSFEAFVVDMGPKECAAREYDGMTADDMSLDRTNCNGIYKPENCRWATRQEQNHNRRNRVWPARYGLPLYVQGADASDTPSVPS